MLRMNWKALSVLASLLIISFSIYAIGKEMGVSSKEKAVSEVIIEAKWGSGPSEYGLYIGKGEGDLTYGPISFTVDSRGYIYIVDGVNHRINIYDGEGNFVKSIPADGIGDIAVAEDGRIYADAGGSIRIYSKDGEILGKYRYKESWREAESRIGPIGGPRRLGIDEDGNPLLWGGPQACFFELKFEDSSCKLIQREGRLGYGGGIQRWQWDFSKDERERILQRFDKLKSIVISLSDTIYSHNFVKSDKENNLYFRGRYKSDKFGTLRLYKYSINGILLGVTEPLPIYYEGFNYVQPMVNNPIMDEEGNIYRVVCTLDGIKVMKWHFVKE